jgi:uncharacterized protein DUF4038/collagenase-like protein with putative collagen-binding domain
MQRSASTGTVGARVVITLLVIHLLAGAAFTQTASGPANSSHAAGLAAYPLKVSPNGRYLVDQNNVPFLIVGDVPQSLVTKVPTTDAEQYFANREARGFNALWINVLTAGPYYHNSPDDGSTYDGIRPFTGYVAGGTDTAHYDLSKPNDAYFARVDQMIMLAANHGMLVFLDPIETGQWRHTLLNNGPLAAHDYGCYLGNRYERFDNIVWLNGNDFNHWKTPADDEVVKAVALGIQSADPRHLQTIELNVETSSSTDDPAWSSIISINGTYTYSPTYFQMWHSYNHSPAMPTFLLEGHYDLMDYGHPVDYGTPSVLRRQEYWAMLSGGKGQLYGNGYTVEFLAGWKDFVDTVAVSQLMIWHSFFTSLPWQDIVPDEDHSVVTAGLGDPGDMNSRASRTEFCTASRTPDGSLVVAYLPTPREITVNMKSLRGAANGKWFDPNNGVYVPISGGPFPNIGERRFAPPATNRGIDDDDWVLLLEAGKTVQ